MPKIFVQYRSKPKNAVIVGNTAQSGFPGESIRTLKLFGLNFTQTTLERGADLVIEAASRRQPCYAVTPNVNLVTLLPFEKQLADICNGATFQFVDGWPIVWVSRKLLGKSLPERVAGADLFPLICQRAEARGLTIGLLGAAPGVADTAAERLRRRYPRLQIVGTFSPAMEREVSEQSTAKMVDFCNRCKPDILVLGMGIPKQERWIAANIHKLDIGIALCFGGVIDFAAGQIKRAPRWVVKLGLEWLWRLFMNPKQYWKRTILRFPLFFPLAIREILTSH